MAKHIASIINELRPRFRAVVESSLTLNNDLEITEHDLGFDIAQNGSVVHIDRSQFDDLIEILKGDS